MKKNLLFTITITLVIFASCTMNAYKSTGEMDFVKEKTEMKPFRNINDPIVITMPVYEKMYLYGRIKENYRLMRLGDIFVVYDWENDKIFDWAFFEGDHGLSNFRAAEIGNPTKYYDACSASDLIGILNPDDGTIKVIKNSYGHILMNMNNNNREKSRYGLLDAIGIGTYDFYVFDSVTEKVNSTPIAIPTESIGYTFYPFADKSGNYWISNSIDSKLYLSEILPADNCIGRSIYICDLDKDNDYNWFDVLFCSDNLIFLADSVVPMSDYLFVVDVSKTENYIRKIDLPPEKSSDNNVFIGAECNGKNYFIRPDYDLLYLDVYNEETDKIENISIHSFDMSETIYVRGSRIYFLNSSGLVNFNFTYYDTELGSWGEIENYSLEDIIYNRF